MSEMPTLLVELATLINRMSGTNEFRSHWKRLRIAVTQDECDEIERFYQADTTHPFIALAIRGVPVLIETHPLEPSIAVKHKRG